MISHRKDNAENPSILLLKFLVSVVIAKTPYR
jgi:hypothetical protein